MSVARDYSQSIFPMNSKVDHLLAGRGIIHLFEQTKLDESKFMSFAILPIKIERNLHAIL